MSDLVSRCEYKELMNQARDIIDSMNKEFKKVDKKYHLKFSLCDLCSGYDKHCVGYIPIKNIEKEIDWREWI